MSRFNGFAGRQVPVTRRLMVLGACSAMAALSACGSSHGGGSGSAAKGPILIDQSVPVQSQTTSLPFMQTSAEAAVAEVNAAGGVKGRKLELTTCDNQYDPNVSLRCAQQAVSNKNVVATVGGLTGFGAQADPLYDQAGLANIGPDAITDADATASSSYLLDAGVPGYAAMPAVAKKYLGATKVAVMDLDNASASDVNGFFTAGAALAGVTIVKRILLPVDATDYSEFVVEAEHAGAQAIVTDNPPPQDLALWKALQATHSTLHTVMTDGSVSQSLVTQAGSSAEGDYVTGGVPPADDSTPTGKAYLAAMKKYQPKEKILTGTGLRAWAAVHLFADVMNAQSGPVTRSSVKTAFDKVSGLHFDWIDSLSFDKAGPLKQYPRIVSTVNFPQVVKNGQLTPVASFNPFGS